MSTLTRRLWTLFEPIHAVTYFAPDALARFEAAGLRGFWRAYFAGRSAPLGAVGAWPVWAAFFSFAPGMVARALPDVWNRATPQAALDARREGSRLTLDKWLGDVDCKEAADLLRAAAENAPTTGRVLAAANAGLPWPDEPLDVLWHAATILREHRGDGHIVALVDAEVDGCEALVWQSAFGNVPERDFLLRARGWTGEEWDAAAERLVARGWLDASGALTAAGRERREAVEATTDRLASVPWRRLGDERAERCAELLAPLTTRVAPALLWPNPIGVPDPRGAGA